LRKKLIKLMPKGDQVCIGIDGMEGIGKTTLTNNLAVLLGAKAISLDDYVDRNRGMYVPHIRCTEVKAAIVGALPSTVIVEGVCLRAVAQRCGLSVHVHVYVRRLSGRLWHDAEICCAATPVDELKQHERELHRWAGVLSGREDLDQAEQETGLRDELIDYHDKWKPVQHADVVFTIAD
jgi:hypothetical protein